MINYAVEIFKSFLRNTPYRWNRRFARRRWSSPWG